MRRIAAAFVGGSLLTTVLLLACGLEVQGLEEEIRTPVDSGGGTDSSTTPPVRVDADPPIVDAGPRELIDSPIDARPPESFRCVPTNCLLDAGAPCANQSCGSTGVPSAGFEFRTTATNIRESMSNGDCYLDIGDSGGYAVHRAAFPAAQRYWYSLRFLIDDLGPTKAVVARIGPRSARIKIDFDGLSIRVCTPAIGNQPSKCTERFNTNGQTDFHIYGMMGNSISRSSVILEFGRTTCTELTTLDFDGPVGGLDEEIEAEIGCPEGNACDLILDDLRFSVAPF